MNKIKFISNSLNIKPFSVENTIKLLDEKATIPFISRYRKEATGELDEVQISNINELSESFDELEKRKEFILKTIKEQGNLDDNLEKEIKDCYNPDFGLCVKCKNEIPPGRLLLVPESTKCVNCARN